MKKLLWLLLGLGLAVGAYYSFKLLPLVTTDNTGNEKVVLLHGLGRSEMAMLQLESALTAAGFDVHSVGYPSMDEAPATLLKTVADKIETCCTDSKQTVHFVGHSLGGLLIRAYLADHEQQNMGRVVLLGSPNKGSELADVEDTETLPTRLLEMAGPTAKALRTGPSGFPASLPPPHYPVGIIAGTRDNRLANEWLPIPNDGLVSVDSARLNGMDDFVSFDVTHWDLRSDPRVAEQVVAFLEDGRFEH